MRSEYIAVRYQARTFHEEWAALGGTGRPASGYYSRDYWMSEATA